MRALGRKNTMMINTANTWDRNIASKPPEGTGKDCNSALVGNTTDLLKMFEPTTLLTQRSLLSGELVPSAITVMLTTSMSAQE